ncbi:MAG: hypothetical protein PCALPYG88_6293 [uncultured Paraburkholderia sp.]|nr:MAG: hypothetical protein PCALPYG08_1724 [uncultured Paraburkholderia sp.]CAH2938480.1 MAG: hypothetical protein PCALPYG88_6293 [uncultured Paraburkholderia sp.]
MSEQATTHVTGLPRRGAVELRRMIGVKTIAGGTARRVPYLLNRSGSNGSGLSAL